MGRRWFKSYSAARRAFNEDHPRLVAEYRQVVSVWVDALLALPLPDYAIEVLREHVPAPDAESLDDLDLTCRSCVVTEVQGCADGCCYNPPEYETYPCAKLTAALPFGHPFPDPPAPPSFGDYWPDPTVRVALAHPWAIVDKEYREHPAALHVPANAGPGDEIDLPHSLAARVKGALVTESRELVRRLS